MKSQQFHYTSFFAFLFSAIGALLLFTLALFFGFSTLFNFLNENGVNVQTTIYLASFSFLGLLLGVVSVVSLLRFLNKQAAEVPVSTSFESWKIVAGVIGTSLTLFIGNLIRDNSSVNWFALPLLTIPAVMFPIWTITGLGTRNLSLGTRWRTLSVLGVSLTITPIVLFVLETLILIVIYLFVVFYVAVSPDVAAEFEKFSTQFMFLDMQSEEALSLLAPYIMKPVIIIPVAIFFSILIPLMEELSKPLAVWFLAGKLDSAAQGFALGAVSGAGFAIVETFNVSGQMAEWGVILFTRIGTGLLHITTSALMGGAIYLAVRERRYLRLLGTYLLAVLLHGLWNASAVTVSFSALAITDIQTSVLMWTSLGGLIVLTISLLSILVISNHKMQKAMLIEIPEKSPVPQDDPIL